MSEPTDEIEFLEEDYVGSSPAKSAARRYRLAELEEQNDVPALKLFLMDEEERQKVAEKKLNASLETAVLLKEEGLYLPHLASV